MMIKSRGTRIACAAALTAAVVGSPLPASASDPVHVDFPAGTACAGFDLGIDIIFGARPQVYKEFTDRAGNIVRTLSAGKGNALTFTNLTTGATYSSKANGSVSQTLLHENGSSTLQLTGHYIVILFPTDHPTGPSTTLYTGRVVVDVSNSAVWTLRQVSGRKVDICAELS